MNDELNYAEMLEIPVETVHINKREKRKKGEPDLKEQLIEDVNERVISKSSSSKTSTNA